MTVFFFLDADTTIIIVIIAITATVAATETIIIFSFYRFSSLLKYFHQLLVFCPLLFLNNHHPLITDLLHIHHLLTIP